MAAGSSLLCLGYGYSAAALARRLMPEGWTVIGTARRRDDLAAIAAAGAIAVPFDEAEEAARNVTHVLASAPPDMAGDPILRALGPALQQGGLKWLAYLSTTGVYGDHAGGWVDETTPCAPISQEGQRRRQAEDLWLASGLPVHIFRLPGIYGPGRSAFDRLSEGSARRIVKPGQVFSRIHVEDIARALACSIARPNPPRIYNIADDEPAPPQDPIAFAAALAGLPIPPEIPFEQADLSPMAQRFYAESKRVSNARAKAELGWSPTFPSYREGLAAIWAARQETAGRH
jgi:nucleoside-diphosphate-sugar epimerase